MDKDKQIRDYNEQIVGLKWQPFLLLDESGETNLENGDSLEVLISKTFSYKVEFIHSKRNTDGYIFQPDDYILNEKVDKKISVPLNILGKQNLIYVLSQNYNEFKKLFFEKGKDEFFTFLLKTVVKNSDNKSFLVSSPMVYNGDVQSVVEFLGKIHENKFYDETYDWITLENINNLLYSKIKFIPADGLNLFGCVKQPITETVSSSQFLNLVKKKPKYLIGDFENLFKELSQINKLSDRDKKIIELEKQLVYLCLKVKGENNPYSEDEDKRKLGIECNRRGRFLVGCLANSIYPETLTKLLFNKDFIYNVLYIPHQGSELFDLFDIIVYCISNAKDEKSAGQVIKKVIKYFKKYNFKKYKDIDIMSSSSDIVNAFSNNLKLYDIVEEAIQICSNKVSKPHFCRLGEFYHDASLHPIYRFCDAEGEKELDINANKLM